MTPFICSYPTELTVHEMLENYVGVIMSDRDQSVRDYYRMQEDYIESVLYGGIVLDASLRFSEGALDLSADRILVDVELPKLN